MTSSLLQELSLYLRPPGQGLYAVSSGKAALRNFTNRYLGLSPQSQKSTAHDFWVQHLQKLQALRGRDAVVILAIPSDAGAGIMRGANHGPKAIREKLKRAPVFDVGDVITVPHFISDDMLSRVQIHKTQDALYQAVPLAKRRVLPVSPLDIAERVCDILYALNSQIRILLLGGDHTVSLAPVRALHKHLAKSQRPLGILHFDAHTDLLSERMGVAHCFATWAYHANVLIGGQERLLQVGIRKSARDQKYWEAHCCVKQIWSGEALSKSPKELAKTVVAHFKKVGVKSLYVSNDLDGTDARFAAACGTPEPGGLTRAHVLTILKEVKALGIPIVGADVVELAPGLSLSRKLSEITIATAVSYVNKELDLLATSF